MGKVTVNQGFVVRKANDAEVITVPMPSSPGPNGNQS